MTPPWEQHPEIPLGSIGWRMGEGELYLETFWSYYNSLSTDQQSKYRKNNRPPKPWSGFYQRGTNKYVFTNISVMLIFFMLLVLVIATFLSPPWWTYIFISPIILIIVGYLVERLLSSYINKLVTILFTTQKTKSANKTEKSTADRL